jgi:peptidoglycan/xylan/chitin deacetylase (PgdA/CDA1 family)
LEREDARGVFFVSTSRLGRDGYLSVAQCHELQERGHAIESHSHDHKPLTQLTAAEVRYQLGESRRRLREQGLGRWDFVAVPGGYLSPEITRAAREERYALLRTLQWGYNRVASPFEVESITINRQTTGCWFRPLISPRFEVLKRTAYRSKEFVKTGRMGRLYFGLRDWGKQ